ncbi:transporter substrate-binding domain-containing protein [Paraburkholderia sp. BCC1886]|uniref:transporter substrate-binding domain-containing protein n=1 Tax=Paraburkholderia sp. BCC1886 TaxID=2562670 RepID=UPI0011826987|nr:transporter substrate-binding domain-containing protein [Paraburkholderia sp. BCC1886]
MSRPRASVKAAVRHEERKPRWLRALLITLAAASAAVFAPAHANELSGTLKKIHDDGVIVLGVREASAPFSYFDGHHTVGYSQTIALQIVDEIRRTLDLPNLRVREVTVTSSNRTPMLLNNQIDLECGSTTHTRDREQKSAFSDSIFVYDVGMITRKNSGVKDFAELTGKPVVTTAGTSVERQLRRLNAEHNLNMRITSAPDHADAFAAFANARGVAFLMDEPIVYGFKASTAHPEDFVVTGTPIGHEVYACMFRKGDPALRDLVNGVIARGQTSGDAERLYQQWFMQPIPPRNINLNFPMSQENRALFAHPNDAALD